MGFLEYLQVYETEIFGKKTKAIFLGKHTHSSRKGRPYVIATFDSKSNMPAVYCFGDSFNFQENLLIVHKPKQQKCTSSEEEYLRGLLKKKLTNHL
jgi:hypothetical protein